MITTVTLNPTLDKTLSVSRLQPGRVHRARILREDLGGKGINVSRALQALGISSRLTGFMGGKTGQIMTSGLEAAGFDVHFVEIEDETRRNITLLDESSNQYTKINEPGPTVSPRHLAALQAQFSQLARPGDLWAFCGSLPPGAAYDLYAKLIKQVQEQGGRALLDTSGRALREGLAAQPFAIKPNSEEAADLLGDPLSSHEEHCAAARRLQSREVPVVALTRGDQGLVLAMDQQVLMASSPSVSARSPVGAGDAALAGLLWAISDACDPFETARRIVACGTATAMQEGTGVGDRRLVEQLLKQVQIADF
jgi:1-phosphofructokinase family hexose kinase